jgi:hypothetical protein
MIDTPPWAKQIPISMTSALNKKGIQYRVQLEHFTNDSGRYNINNIKVKVTVEYGRNSRETAKQ